MKLTASLIIRNELGRYLEPCIAHLLEFCDEIRVLDDFSSDGTCEWLRGLANPRLVLLSGQLLIRNGEEAFLKHARERNRLLQFTLAGEPTHVLAIDADEFVSDGPSVRAACEDGRFVAWRLCLQEVWNAREDTLAVRQDGGWVEHDVPMLWRPGRLRRPLTISDRGHATGRVPDAVYRTRTGSACTELLHFGWVKQAERQERFNRYAIGDAGRFHAKAHIESIMWPDERIRLTPRDWPEGLAPYKEGILERANVEAVV